MSDTIKALKAEWERRVGAGGILLYQGDEDEDGNPAQYLAVSVNEPVTVTEPHWYSQTSNFLKGTFGCIIRDGTAPDKLKRCYRVLIDDLNDREYNDFKCDCELPVEPRRNGYDAGWFTFEFIITCRVPLDVDGAVKIGQVGMPYPDQFESAWEKLLKILNG